MMNTAWELRRVVLVVVSDVESLFFQLLCFLWIGKQTFKNEFVIWKDSCDQVSLNRIQDVIFEPHYPHQEKKKKKEKRIRKKVKVEKKHAEIGEKDRRGEGEMAWRRGEMKIGTLTIYSYN